MTLDLRRIDCLGDALYDALVARKSNTALIEVSRKEEARRLSYLEVLREATRTGALLQGGGFEPGARCAIIMQNQSRWITAAIGAFWAGAVLVPIDYKLDPRDQLALLRHCGASVLVTEPGLWRRLHRQGDLPAGLRVLVGEITLADGPAEPLDAPATHTLQRVPRRRADVATIVYSSGTSGTPKGCQLTHANYLAQAESLGALYPLKESHRYFSILPTNHAIDFMCGFVVPLLFGAGVVHQRALRPELIAWTMRHYGISHMAVVPLILKALKTRLEERLDALPAGRRAAIDALIAAL